MSFFGFPTFSASVLDSKYAAAIVEKNKFARIVHLWVRLLMDPVKKVYTIDVNVILVYSSRLFYLDVFCFLVLISTCIHQEVCVLSLLTENEWAWSQTTLPILLHNHLRIGRESRGFIYFIYLPMFGPLDFLPTRGLKFPLENFFS